MADIQQTPILPPGWQRARGYAYAVSTAGGKTVRIAGQVAVREGKGPVEEGLDLGAQFDIALGNLVTVVRAAGGQPTNLAMLRAYVTDMAAFHASGKAIGEAWARHLGKHFPAMTLVEVAGLYDKNALVEIEGEAVIA